MSKKPHKHAELIKAWADGAEIEFYDTRFEEHRWKLCGTPPLWREDFEYRIKPEPKPDVVRYACHDRFENSPLMQLRLYRVEQNIDNPSTGQLKLTFDGETGKLKSAEVLE
jgi:hypothetical protein